MIHHGASSDDRVVVTISGEVAPGYEEEFERGDRPLADYKAIADAANADLLDRRDVKERAGLLGRIIERVAGPNVAMAVQLFRERNNYDVIFTDGEQVGLPLSLLLQLSGPTRPRHVMIAHRVSAEKKRAVVRLLGLTRGVDELLVYSTSQLQAGRDLFHRRGQRVTLIDFMVDTHFFARQERHLPNDDGRRPLLVTAGREFRDYPTMIDAVAGLDVDVVVASASPWSRRRDNAFDTSIPDNVTVTKLTQRQLRDLFDIADMAVVPLQPVDFQAGITTILEAMAMELPIVCTTTIGQIDVVADGHNGRYVGPGDVGAMRRAIVELLEDGDLRHGMGKAGRRLAEERADVRVYARGIAEVLARQGEIRREKLRSLGS